MKAVFLMMLVLIGTAYCRSLPAGPQPPSGSESIDVKSLSGDPVALIRKARQFGYYNNYDYNPYNDTPNNYDNNPFNDSPHRPIYNNFDFNPFNDSPNNYDGNPFNNSGFFGNLGIFGK